MTSVARELGHDVTIDHLSALVARAFGQVFHLEPRAISREMLDTVPR
jgi:hypothetical protein